MFGGGALGGETGTLVERIARSPTYRLTMSSWYLANPMTQPPIHKISYDKALSVPDFFWLVLVQPIRQGLVTAKTQQLRCLSLVTATLLHGSICQVPCDHIPQSRYPLIRAREVCEQLIATIRARSAETNG